MTRLPDPEETAAIAAAVERFLVETSPVAGEERPATGAWQRAALLEGVAARSRPMELDGKGGTKWLS